MPAGDTRNEKGRFGWVRAALFAQCPQCGNTTLFDGAVQFAPRCRSCGLNFESFNVGDGPAAFLTLIIGALTVGLALWVDSAFRPPFWVHALLWIPFTTAAVIYGLRVGKAALLNAEYANRAGEADSGDVASERAEGSP